MDLAERIRALNLELRRRKVFHVAGAYGAVGIAISIAVPDLFGAFRFPSWAAPLVIVIIAIGFPIALVLAWAYELKPGSDEAATPVDVGRDDSPNLESEYPRNRIAILPLDNYSPHEGDRYFADGMTEELISVVSRIEGLEVIARTSVMVYKDVTTSITDIANDLSVGAILEGSVRRDGDALRITVQLIETATSTHLWAEDYDRNLSDIFQVQRDIARQVTEALEVRLLAKDEEQIGKTPTKDLQAYDYHLIGRHHLNTRTDESLRKALEYFDRAIVADPSFALPVAGQSEALLFLGLGYSVDPPENALSKASEAAERAVELDNSLPEAYVALAFARMHTLDLPAAKEAAARALELNPGHAQAHPVHGWFLVCPGDYEGAIAAYDRALALDPKSFVLMTESGWPYGYQGRHEIAIERYRAALEMAPGFALAQYNVGWALQRMGRLDEAIQAYEEALTMSGGVAFVRAWLATAYVEAGRESEARKILAGLSEEWREGNPVGCMLAVVHEALGEKAEAIEALKRAYEAREPSILWVGRTAEFCGFDTLRDEPRYQELMRRIDGS
jgi:adenylate cyclase